MGHWSGDLYRDYTGVYRYRDGGDDAGEWDFFLRFEQREEEYMRGEQRTSVTDRVGSGWSCVDGGEYLLFGEFAVSFVSRLIYLYPTHECVHGWLIFEHWQGNDRFSRDLVGPGTAPSRP
jgi:hypothetical protein